MTLSYIIASILETMIGNIITRVLYIASATWFGVVFFLFTITLLFDIVNLFFKIRPAFMGYGIIIIVIALTSISIFNASTITVKTYTIPADVDMKIVHLSDLHIGSVHKSWYLKKIVDKTNELKPDAVMITGDLVDGPSHIGKEDIAPLKKINSEVFYVTGNHENYIGIDKVMTLINNNTHLKFLRNERTSFKGVEIIGIDDSENRKDAEKVLDDMKINNSKYSILLFHRPNLFDSAVSKGINLQLSGHTHNGQIFPFNLIVKAFFPRIKGLYEKDGSYLLTSTGTGTWGPPMRLGSRNEINVIELKKE